ncbi:MAG: hypothetical protein ACYCWW_15280 [Deltaproteobacteria bacterium]
MGLRWNERRLLDDDDRRLLDDDDNRGLSDDVNRGLVDDVGCERRERRERSFDGLRRGDQWRPGRLDWHRHGGQFIGREWLLLCGIGRQLGRLRRRRVVGR